MYAFARRALFTLPPEVAHRVALGALHAATATPIVGSGLRRWARPDDRPTQLLGLHFRNPIGLAAGFDKDGRHIEAMAALGFGFVEIGSVTCRPSTGNARPRLFRLPVDGALINRMGLNNEGADAVATRLARSGGWSIPVFVNVAKTHDPHIEGDAAIDDYVRCVRRVAPVADALVINISCPNSGDGRTFEDPTLLGPLLDAVMGAVEGPPVLVKVSPDLDDDQLRAVARLALDAGVRGFTATNTTVDRSALSTDEARLDAIGPGGLSGRPLHARALKSVLALRAYVGDDVPIVGVGGVRDGRSAQAFVDAGADLVQLYTGFIYGGPGIVRRICVELDRPALSS